MASKRAVQLLALRSNATALCRQTPQLRLQAARAFSIASRSQIGRTWQSRVSGLESPRKLQVGGVTRRWDSNSSEERVLVKLYEFEDVVQILESPSSSRLLVDVREPHEYKANTIPTAINIPVASQPDALLLDEEDFAERFGFQKPPLGKEVVFFCKAGVRSSAAAAFAKQAGYTNVGEYRGSWLDWQKRGGPGTKSPSPPGGLGEAKGPVSETKPTSRTGSSGEEDLGSQGVPGAPEGPLGKQ
ncbi:Rhodanese-like protein [Plenodomus tracheiphilus IPT5]|uniref:Rhodanese-like protein n=1 Tax=Plenodomus tracheiphilus IPT5 TaxID=1408161 RepID=A0A6A7B1Q4_9PLEO|nr:Rhodanese-like protein [Plenodomus tracheiphilus IPT5]